jgi:ABC-2 type transport system permease protein
MRKLLTIAKREYGAMVATKAFLISVTLMPLMMFASVFFASRMERLGQRPELHIVVADGSGGALFDELKKAGDARNAALAQAAQPATPAENAADNPDPMRMKSRDIAKQASGVPSESKYILERFPKDQLTDEDRLALSNRVRNEELAAFVELPADLAAVKPSDGRARFYAQNAMLSSERRWIEEAVNEVVRARRFAELKLDPTLVRQATAPVAMQPLGLYKQAADGRIIGADESRNMLSVFLPMGFMMLMFMTVFMSAQPLLESVMEERTGRIAEVLLGSVSPGQLMAGKLLGNVAGSLSVLAIYGVGAYGLALYKGWADMIPGDLIRWFLVYELLAVLMFSSLFMAVGSAVNNSKDAQAMLVPIWLVICIPMFVWLQITREPNGPVATWMSFFPPATPLTMVLRLASDATIPAWQIAASLAVLLVSTLACIYAAGRIFRLGILWQGKTPKLTELVQWAFQ